MSTPLTKRKPSDTQALQRLADLALESPDLAHLVQLLTRELPDTMGLARVTLLLWDRKLESFETVAGGETLGQGARPGEGNVPAPEARYFISEGTLLETPGGKGEGVLLPLLARSGLVGMLMLDPGRARKKPPFSSAEVRLLSLLASRSALAMENHVYQRELIESERMAALGVMTSMLAHDFRGPMTVIRGYAETIQNGVYTDEEARERARVIVEMVDRMERMTVETLDFARGAGRLARRTMELPALLEELARGIEQEFPRLRVERLFAPCDGIAAAVDLDKLRRVVGNIAANARDAMGGQGRLQMVADVGEGPGERAARLVLEIADEGPGVPPEIRERLFEPFVSRGKKGGTGLGLAVARRFVEDHGGSLDLLEEGPGARFRIVLPLKDAHVPAAESKQADVS
jgi:signal transduction histidine kinase